MASSVLYGALALPHPSNAFLDDVGEVARRLIEVNLERVSFRRDTRLANVGEPIYRSVLPLSCILVAGGGDVGEA